MDTEAFRYTSPVNVHSKLMFLSNIDCFVEFYWVLHTFASTINVLFHLFMMCGAIGSIDTVIL